MGAGYVDPRVTRRQALQVGVLATAAAVELVGADDAAAARREPRTAARAETSFDLDWRFFRGEVPGAERPDFDDRAWRLLDLPHDFQIEDLADGSDDGGATADPSAVVTWTDRAIEARAPARIGPFDKEAEGGRSVGYTVGGEGWYRKHFRLDGLPAAHRVELRFDGVFHRSDVWLNGEHLGFHPYGFTAFGYDLTPHLRRDAENVLAVRVRTTGETARWYAGSGIYRHTRLKVTGPVRVPHWGVAIDTPVVGDDRARVRARVNVDNAGDKAVKLQVRQILKDPDGRVVASRLSKRRSVDSGKS
jgi:beta-galactosidase